MIALTFVVVFGFMIAEARRAARNERAQLSRGGREAAGDVYALMQVAYPGLFLAMIVEGAMRGGPLVLARFVAGLAVFAAAKALKWWAIGALGPYWTFRVIVVPGTEPVRSGPYRFLKHPNYVGVIGEIAGVALMMSAGTTGPIALVIFGALLVRRIAVENRALDAILRRS